MASPPPDWVNLRQLPDPKPTARIRDSRAGTEKLRREGCCRVCRSKHLLAKHHVVPRSQRGDDVDANLVPLCDGCHGSFHRNDQPEFRGGQTIAQTLRLKLHEDEIEYVIGKMGAAWLELRYPRPAR